MKFAEAIGAPVFNGNGWANTSLIQSEPFVGMKGNITVLDYDHQNPLSGRGLLRTKFHRAVSQLDHESNIHFVQVMYTICTIPPPLSIVSTGRAVRQACSTSLR